MEEKSADLEVQYVDLPDLEMKGGYWHESMENFFSSTVSPIMR